MSPCRIDYREKWKPVKIGIASVNLLDSMLAHEHGGMRIVQNVSS